MSNAREVAMKTLAACQRQGAWSDAHLKKAVRDGGLDRRDAALATRLCFGVLQNRMLLDWYLARYSKTPLSKLDVFMLQNLRIAVYQILMMDKIPVSAAVNGFNKELLASHIHTCVADKIRAGDDGVIDELVATMQKLMK